MMTKAADSVTESLVKIVENYDYIPSEFEQAIIAMSNHTHGTSQ